MAFEDFERSSIVNDLQSGIQRVVDDTHSLQDSSDYSISDYIVDIQEGGLDVLRFSHVPDLFFNAIDIRVRYPESDDIGIPQQMGSAKHKPIPLILEVDAVDDTTGTIVTRNVTVVAKALGREFGEKELFAYNKIADNLNHLDVVAIIGSEFEEGWLLVTIADPHLVAMETFLSAELNNLSDISRISQSGSVADTYRYYEERIAGIIIDGLSEIKRLHQLGILHRDSEVKNVLLDLRFSMDNPRFVLCDYETSINRDSEHDDKSETSYDINRYINSSIKILTQSLSNEGNLTDEQRQMLQDSIERIKAEVDKRV
jgi:serine/threonine protein kinase